MKNNNMPYFSSSYRELQERLHTERPDYGTSSSKHCDPILGIASQLGTRDILDYACGKALLQKGIPFPIQNYDPFIPEYSRRPVAADIVVCTDALEHIEPDCLKAVMDDIRNLTLKMLFVEVACRPAKKFLADGRNAHLIVESPNWWLTWLLPRFALHSFQANSGSFTAILTPLVNKAIVENVDSEKNMELKC